MRRVSGILLLASAFMMAGCSKTESTSIIAFKWSIGQHETCVYARSHIYCNSPEQWPAGPQPGKVSWSVIAHVPYRAEQERSHLNRDATAEAGTYDVKYSKAPLDFSLWDCIKTGGGSPAITCELLRKPSDSEIAEANDDERKTREHNALALKAHSFLQGLTRERLAELCGPGKVNTGFISDKITYANATGTADAIFEYATYGSNKGSLDTVHTSGPKPALWYHSSDVWKEDALNIVQGIPCLAKDATK
jgi:hypothetical protein